MAPPVGPGVGDQFPGRADGVRGSARDRLMKVSRALTKPSDPVVKVWDVAYIRFQKPDLGSMERYLRDFGLHLSARTADTIYMRGAGPTHHIYIAERGRRSQYLGLGFAAADRTDLERIATVPGASKIHASPEPGGGQRVVLQDPSGFRVDVVWGMEELPELPIRPPLPVNGPKHKVRVNRPQQTLIGPAGVYRLGHVVLQSLEFFKTAAWYMNNFGLVPSDVLLLENHEPAVVFLRCNRGRVLTDHHTLVVSSGIQNALDHCAFEVPDLDAVANGAQWLQHQGWRQSWGVGRHVLGSQIFDYQHDPFGTTMEHFADGDVFDEDYATGFHRLDKQGLYQWGPDLPKSFGAPSITPAKAVRLLTALAGRGEASLARLSNLKKAMEAPARPWLGRSRRGTRARWPSTS
ncbi:MAG: glyoxalase [Candidatus Rokuibacteriota bacterium]|nr:MAG: glyoxalase [Candidatus Rokubacteria bacterium]